MSDIADWSHVDGQQHAKSVPEQVLEKETQVWVRCKGFRVCDAKHATCCRHESHSRCNDAPVVVLRLWDQSMKTAVVFLSKLLVVL